MRVIGRYALYDEIAAGGMATVHIGRLLGPVGFSRTVAIKRLHAQYAKDPEFVSMFLDEARIAARIRHPNVVQTLDVVAAKGELFLVMDYVQGESLSKLIRASISAGERLPPRVVATIMCGALAGLRAAHEARTERGEPLNIVHRDVSPQNIIVGQDGIPRLLDFGVAHAAGRLQTTRDGQLKGKLAYMAPEQLSGDVGPRTDVFAAALVMWEALTARRLFEGDNEAVILQKMLAAPIEAPSVHAPEARALDEVVLRGLERDPEKRWQSAKEMGAAIERAIGLASTSEVGEWIEHVASATLAARANRVAEIESSSERIFVIPSAPDREDTLTEPDRSGGPDKAGAFPPQSPTSTPAFASDAFPPARPGVDPISQRSQLSSISVSRTKPPPAARRGALVVAIASGVVVVLVAIVVVGKVMSGEKAVAGATATATASASATATAAATVVTATATAAEAATQTATATATAVKAPSAHASTKATVTATATARACDPPFAIDAQGHKKWKPECIN